MPFDHRILNALNEPIKNKIISLYKGKEPIISGKINDIYKTKIFESAFTKYEMITKIKNTN